MNMTSDASASAVGGAIWQHIQFQGDLSPGAARALLKFRFLERDHARMEELSAKARAGALAPAEQVELDEYERLGYVLDIIHSRARQALKAAHELPQERLGERSALSIGR